MRTSSGGTGRLADVLTKSFPIESCKTIGEAGSGQYEAIVSVFGNIDKVKDRVLPGAFAKAITEQDPPPIVWSHHWEIPPIGETLDWSESSKGLHIKGELFVGADDNHQYADMVYAGMKSRDGRAPALKEHSFHYGIPDGGEERKAEVIDGQQTVVNNLKTLFPIYEVGPTLKGCNPLTETVATPKSDRIARALGHLKTVDPEIAKKVIEAQAGKSYDDIRGWPISLLLEMIDSGTSYIQAVEDEPDVETMKRLVRELLDLLNKDFDEGGKSDDGDVVRDSPYSPEVMELLLAAPDH